MQRIGILTGGGDCPGLNSVIRAVVKKAGLEGCQVFGFRNGWKGVIDDEFILLDPVLSPLGIKLKLFAFFLRLRDGDEVGTDPAGLDDFVRDPFF